MTDRELLELAAKAYWGDEIDDVCSIRWLELDQAIGYTHGDNQDHNGEDREFVWNPLEDDGDAFRLLVKLRIALHYEYQLGDECVEAVHSFNEDDRSSQCVLIPIGADPEESTRRAIVRAAAEIGKALK